MAKKSVLFVATSLLATSVFMPSMAADQSSPFSQKIVAAMKAESRSDKDKARDDNRMPVETLAFFGIKQNMKVLELVPGGGWYSRLLAPALAEQGAFYVGVGTSRLEKVLAEEPLFKETRVVAKGTKFSRSKDQKGTLLSHVELQHDDFDAVLTFRNYHNFSIESRMMLNDKVFAALKPGGIYGVVDHTRRHMQADDSENGRRVDPVLAIKEIVQAGFEFVDYSDLHYRADDELRYEVGRKTVTGNTDRFTLLFKKPQ